MPSTVQKPDVIILQSYDKEKNQILTFERVELGGLFKISALKMNRSIKSITITDSFQVWLNNTVILTALPVTLTCKVDDLYIINSCL